MDSDKFEGRAIAVLSYAIAAVVVLTVFLLAQGCSPRIIETVRTEYVYRDKIQKDTTFIRDSVFVKEYVKGDTVRIIEYKDRFHYDFKYIYKTDTLIKVDSVAVEKVKEVKIEKPLKWWQKFRMEAFWVLVGLLAFAYRKTIVKLFKLI